MTADHMQRRVGLAVALGVGTVIACTTASPAWASEDGESAGAKTSPDTSQSTETPTPRGKRESERPGGSEKSDDEKPPPAEGTGEPDDTNEPEIPQDRTPTRSTTILTPVRADEQDTDEIPEPPSAVPALWSLVGSTRRDDEDETAGEVVSPTPTGEPVAAQADPQAPATTDVPTPTDGPAWESLYTGEPSWFHNVVTAGLNVLKVVFKPLGGLLRYTSLKIPIFTDGVPPFFVRPGLDVERTEFAGMKVWSLAPRENKTDKVVVALHGGSYEGQVNVFQWSTYAVMARDTRATVVVPLYELAPKGTAATEVPRTANFITTMIDEHGAENVSVLGDSAGGGLALAALQEVARRNSRQPSRLVLLAPWLDVSMSDPRSEEIKDPLLDIPNLARPGAQWAGPAGTADPMASPLFGSLDGLPPTYVYSSSRDLLTVDTLRLRDRVLAEGIPDVTFRLRAGLIHDWYIFPFLPDARTERPNVYADLLGSPVSAPAFLATK